MKIALVSKKNRWFEQILSSLHGEHTVIPIHHKEDLETSLSTHSPDWVFVFHWSYIIDKSIYSKYKCVSFHTGNLPNDRGGSPIQNQILNGKKFSRVNAIVVQDPVDSGAVYCSKEISLQGSLQDIWGVITDSVITLIQHCIITNPTPIEQVGSSTTYKRKKDNILKLTDIKSIYNQIRMLDGESYPNTYLEIDGFKLDFSRATMDGDQILSDVRIYKI